MTDLIGVARNIGKAEGAVAVAMVVIKPSGQYAIVTWGSTRKRCATMKAWGNDLDWLVNDNQPDV